MDGARLARVTSNVVELELTGEVWEWRGPAPYHFVSVPEELVDEVREAGELVSYGWGMVPVTLRIGATEWTTSLWPKDGGYVVPLKDKVRRAEWIELGDRGHGDDGDQTENVNSVVRQANSRRLLSAVAAMGRRVQRRRATARLPRDGGCGVVVAPVAQPSNIVGEWLTSPNRAPTVAG